jgi:hypothetical protein
MVRGTLEQMSTSPPPRRRVLWRSPWAWPPVGIVLAAVAGQWLGHAVALIVLCVVAILATLGLLEIVRTPPGWRTRPRWLFRR